MKRLFSLFITLVMLLCMLCVSVAYTAERPIEVYCLGTKLEFPVPPRLVGNTAMVPMRALFEALGYYIEWNSKFKVVTAYRDNDIITLTVGENSATVNNKPYHLEAPALLLSGSTLVPLRFIGEASGCDVLWDDAARSITLTVSDKMKTALSEKRAGYIADIIAIKTSLPIKHKNLFFYQSKKVFDAEMNVLIQNAATYSEYQMKFELMRIITAFNDPHTAVNLKTYGYGFRFYQFEDGIYLIDGPQPYQPYIGKKLTAINQVSLEEIVNKLIPVVPFENDALRKDKLCTILEKPSFYFRAIGLTKSIYEPLTFTFENDSIMAVQNNEKLPLISQLSESKNTYPLYYINRGLPYSFCLLNNDKVMYVKYNSGSNILTYPFSAFTKDVFSAIDKKAADTLIIDLRDNSGGNSNILAPFIKEIVKRSTINRKGHLYIMVGRRTFSSAVVNAMQLKAQTTCIAVGEPTGGSPNYYSSLTMMSFQNLDITLSYPTDYIQTVEENVHTLTPDVIVTQKAASFFAGRDDFLEAVYAEMAR